MRSEKNFASSINIFCACLFCPSVSKIYSQFYFLSRKNWNNYNLSEKNLYLKNFKTFVENYIKEKICHEISIRNKPNLQTEFHRLIWLSVNILFISFHFEMLEMNYIELSWTTIYFLQYIKRKCKQNAICGSYNEFQIFDMNLYSNNLFIFVEHITWTLNHISWLIVSK